MSNNTVLVVAPHMDDETLGMGGTIARHSASGDTVHVCFVAHRIYQGRFTEDANKREIEHALLAKEKLGYSQAEFLNLNDERLDVALQDVIKPIEKYIEKINPDIVYSNFYGDNNQDHRAVFQAMRVAIRPYAKAKVKEWYLYEAPSSTDQSPPIAEASFLPNYYVNIESTFNDKVKALECYETEIREFPNPRSPEALEVLAKKRGSETGMQKAEAFMTMRRYWE